MAGMTSIVDVFEPLDIGHREGSHCSTGEILRFAEDDGAFER
jgi:hypothetical protein